MLLCSEIIPIVTNSDTGARSTTSTAMAGQLLFVVPPFWARSAAGLLLILLLRAGIERNLGPTSARKTRTKINWACSVCCQNIPKSKCSVLCNKYISVLLEDIRTYSITNSTKRWLCSDLRGCSTFVEFRGRWSTMRKVGQGVTQGKYCHWRSSTPT